MADWLILRLFNNAISNVLVM